MPSCFRLYLAALLALTALPVAARTLRVPAQYPRIQTAVNAAFPGDTVLVGPGTYAERVTISFRLHLLAVPGAERPTITLPAGTDGTFPADLVGVTAAGPGTIAGFHLLGLDGYSYGVHLYADGWEVLDNVVSHHEFGVDAMNVSALIVGNELERNDVMAIRAGRTTHVLRNVARFNNIAVLVCDDAVVENNVLRDHFEAIRTLECGGSVRPSRGAVRNNTIVADPNTNAGSQQTGIRMQGGVGGTHTVFENNVVAYSGRTGIEQYGAVASPPYAFRYNDVFGNNPDYSASVGNRTGVDGNVSVAPLFDSGGRAFVLRSDSPLIDAGSPALADPDGSRSDVGATGGPNALPVRYAPASFDLLAPTDAAVVGSTVRFEWGASFDRDPGDDVTYRLEVGVYATPWGPWVPLQTVETAAPWAEVTLSLPDSTLGLPLTWRVDGVDDTGLLTRSTTERVLTQSMTGVEPGGMQAPSVSVGPNPARGVATVRLALPDAGRVRVEVYDALGRVVAVLHEGLLGAGAHVLPIEAGRLAPGVYVVLVSGEGIELTQAVTLVR